MRTASMSGQHILLFAAMLIAAPLSNSVAQTSWTGASSTSWNVAGNWTSGVPTASVDAVIGDASFTGAFQPTVNATATCRSLTLGAGTKASTLTVADNNLTVAQGITIGANGTVTHSGTGTVTLSGNFSNSGTYNATNTGATTVFAGTSQSLTLVGTTVFKRVTINAGSTVTQSSGTLEIRDFTISSGGTMNQQGGLLVMARNWMNSGTFNATGGTVRFSTVSASVWVSFATGTNQFFNLIIDSGIDPGFDYAAGSVISVAGDFTNNNTTLSVSANATFVFNGSGNQTVTSASASGNSTFGNLTVNKTAGSVTLNSSVQVRGNATITSGTLDCGANSFSRTVSGGTLTIGAAGVLKIGGTNTFPTSFTTRTLNTGSTVEYSGTAQTITALTYSNLTLSGSGTKTLGGATTVNGKLSMQGTATMSLGGNTLTYGSASPIEYKGSSAQTTGVEFPSTVPAGQSVIINNANGVTLNASRTISGTLTLTSGNLIAGSYTLTLGSSTSVLGTLTRTSGTIVGTFARWFAASVVSGVLFPVGTAAAYRPSNLSFTAAPSAGGTLTVAFVASDPGGTGLPLSDGGTSIVRCAPDGYWQIVSGNGLTGGTYSLDLTAAGFGGVSDYTTLRILKRATGGSWTLNGTHAAGTGSNSVPVAHRTGMSGFSEFGIGGAADNPLPIQLLTFSARIIEGGGVLLEWSTATEVNNYGFTLERKPAGAADFAQIPGVFIAGSGTTNVTHRYSYLDAAVASGSWSYRLKQMDADGTVHTYDPIQVRFEPGKISEPAPEGFSIAQNFPNPCNPATTIRYTLPIAADVKLIVHNSLGQEVAVLVDAAVAAGSYSVKFDASRLASGVYYYQLRAGSIVQTRRLLVVR